MLHAFKPAAKTVTKAVDTVLVNAKPHMLVLMGLLPIGVMQASPFAWANLLSPVIAAGSLLLARRAGRLTGHAEGHEQGKVEGHLDGYNQGFDQGESGGYYLGKSDGYDIGHGVGYAEGHADGMLDQEVFDLCKNGVPEPGKIVFALSDGSLVDGYAAYQGAARRVYDAQMGRGGGQGAVFIALVR